jgi:hypothetical protein
VVALRATVRALRAELDAVWESAAAASVMGRMAERARWELTLPLVRVALAPAEVAETRVAAASTPALAGVTSIVLDLRPDTPTTQIVLDLRPDTPTTQIVLPEPAEIVPTGSPDIVLADLPESALIDPKQARDSDVIDVSEPATASAADTILPARRIA